MDMTLRQFISRHLAGYSQRLKSDQYRSMFGMCALLVRYLSAICSVWSGQVADK